MTVDLRPRSDTAPGPPPRRRRRWIGGLVITAVLGVGAGVIAEGLSEATLYFRNVDEALAQRDALGDRRFRLQGTLGDDIRRDGDRVTFTLSHDGATIDVVHRGHPPEMFTPGQAIVVEGGFTPGTTTFASDHILVKHDAEYEAENRDRLTSTTNGESTR